MPKLPLRLTVRRFDGGPINVAARLLRQFVDENYTFRPLVARNQAAYEVDDLVSACRLR
jgi:hypothetical protein